MIGVIDYGAGNLQSVANALDHLGLPHARCAEVADLADKTHLILPGVGHFGAAGRHLQASGLDDGVRARAAEGTPLLGICLGLQLLLDGSAEASGTRGLGLIPGQVVPLEARRSPHMGWNRVRPERDDAVLAAGDFFYFAHGYVARLDDERHRIADTEVETHAFPSVIGHGRIRGVQFHPEKSGDAGLALLRAFARC